MCNSLRLCMRYIKYHSFVRCTTSALLFERTQVYPVKLWSVLSFCYIFEFALASFLTATFVFIQASPAKSVASPAYVGPPFHAVVCPMPKQTLPNSKFCYNTKCLRRTPHLVRVPLYVVHYKYCTAQQIVAAVDQLGLLEFVAT